MHADHTIFNDLQSEKRIKDIVQFLDKIEQLQNINRQTPYIKNSPTSGITILESDIVQTMVSRAFQEKLWSHHVIITDVHLFWIACDRHGLLSLHGLKEIVDIEGIILIFTYSNIC
jgi:hypothetical protein